MAAFGFDIRDAAQGASAMTSILSQGDELAQTKATTAIKQEAARAAPGEADAVIAKSSYEVDRYAALEKFGKEEEAGRMGRDAHEIYSGGKEIQQRKQELQQKESSIRGLKPQDQMTMQSSIDREQKQIDALEMKQLGQTEKLLGEGASLLENVNSPEQLAGAKAYMSQNQGAFWDKEHEGQPPNPQGRENFIRDKVKESLPDKWNKEGEAFKAAKLGSLLGAKEYVSLEKNKRDNALATAKIQHESYQLGQVTKQAELRFRTADRSDAKLELDNVHRQIGEAVQQERVGQGDLKRLQTDLQNIYKDGKAKTPTGESAGWFSKAPEEDNPEIALIKSAIEDKKLELGNLAKNIKTADLTREAIQIKHGLTPTPVAKVAPEPVSPKTPSYSPAQEDWITRAQASNPGMSKEDIIKEGKRSKKL